MKWQSSVAVPENFLVNYIQTWTHEYSIAQPGGPFSTWLKCAVYFVASKPLGQPLVHDTMEKKLSKIVKTPREPRG